MDSSSRRSFRRWHCLQYSTNNEADGHGVEALIPPYHRSAAVRANLPKRGPLGRLYTSARVLFWVQVRHDTPEHHPRGLACFSEE